MKHVQTTNLIRFLLFQSGRHQQIIPSCKWLDNKLLRSEFLLYLWFSLACKCDCNLNGPQKNDDLSTECLFWRISNDRHHFPFISGICFNKTAYLLSPNIPSVANFALRVRMFRLRFTTRPIGCFVWLNSWTPYNDGETKNKAFSGNYAQFLILQFPRKMKALTRNSHHLNVAIWTWARMISPE